MKKAIIAIVLLGIIGLAVGYFMYNKPHENIENAKVDFSMTADALVGEYEADEAASDAKYLDKLVEVSGTVESVSKDEDGIINVTLEGGMFGVTCKLDELSEHQRTEFPAGTAVKFKGKLTGALMGAPLLVRCVEVK